MMNRKLSTATPISAIGVYGLVSFLYGGERLDLYTFCAVSLALLFLLWPRRLEWEAMFKECSAEVSRRRVHSMAARAIRLTHLPTGV